MKKRLISMALCLAFGASMLAGCAKSGDTGTDSGDSAASAGEDVTIQMFISSPEYADAINTLIAEYKKVKPNVSINYETTQNDYPTLLKAKINAGECPDIFSSMSGKEIAVYGEYSQNLNGQPMADALDPAVRDLMTMNGEVHGIAIKGNLFGLVYNQGIFDEVGITQFPTTYSELEKACETISAAGYTPFSTGYAEWWVFKHMFQHFLDAAAPEDVEALMNELAAGNAHLKDYPAIYNDFFRFVDLTLKYGDAKPLESDLSTEVAALGSGKTAMILGQGAWVEADILKIDPSIKIGFNGYPLGDTPDASKVISGSDQAVRIYKDSKVLDEVFEFCNWWYTSDYGKTWFSDVTGVIPPISAGTMPDFEIVKQGNALIEQEGAATLAVAYATDSFWQAFGEIMQGYVTGAKDKDTICSEIEAKWVELEGASQS
jgi:hypothetical protein